MNFWPSCLESGKKVVVSIPQCRRLTHRNRPINKVRNVYCSRKAAICCCRPVAPAGGGQQSPISNASVTTEHTRTTPPPEKGKPGEFVDDDNLERFLAAMTLVVKAACSRAELLPVAASACVCAVAGAGYLLDRSIVRTNVWNAIANLIGNTSDAAAQHAAETHWLLHLRQSNLPSWARCTQAPSGQGMALPESAAGTGHFLSAFIHVVSFAAKLFPSAFLPTTNFNPQGGLATQRTAGSSQENDASSEGIILFTIDQSLRLTIQCEPLFASADNAVWGEVLGLLNHTPNLLRRRAFAPEQHSTNPNVEFPNTHAADAGENLIRETWAKFARAGLMSKALEARQSSLDNANRQGVRNASRFVANYVQTHCVARDGDTLSNATTTSGFSSRARATDPPSVESIFIDALSQLESEALHIADSLRKPIVRPLSFAHMGGWSTVVAEADPRPGLRISLPMILELRLPKRRMWLGYSCWPCLAWTVTTLG